MTEREEGVSLADQLRERAAGYRRVYDNYGLKLDCSTINGALEYGRAQGMEMAADYIDKLPAPTPPCGGEAKTGHVHTAIMDAIREDIVRQHPDAFTEDTDAEIVIPVGAVPVQLYVKLDVSALAEAGLSALT